MRRLFIALALTSFATGASAADYELPEPPVLRGSSPYVPGPPVYTRWEGVYVGGQVGYSRAGVDFRNSVQPLIDELVRNSTLASQVGSWTVIPPGRSDASSFSGGAFIGYNMQFDDAVIGVEVNYSHTNLHKDISDSLSRTFTDPNRSLVNHTYWDNVTVTGATSVQITDIWTGRFRGGWALDNFLTYGFVGVALARANASRSATVDATLTDIFTDPNTGFSTATTVGLVGYPASLVDSQGSLFTWGYTAGLGIDYLFAPNFFIRGEWEYVQLPNVKNNKININTVRTALGFKF